MTSWCLGTRWTDTSTLEYPIHSKIKHTKIRWFDDRLVQHPRRVRDCDSSFRKGLLFFRKEESLWWISDLFVDTLTANDLAAMVWLAGQWTVSGSQTLEKDNRLMSDLEKKTSLWCNNVLSRHSVERCFRQGTSQMYIEIIFYNFVLNK